MRQGTRPSRLAGVAAEIGRSFGAAYSKRTTVFDNGAFVVAPISKQRQVAELQVGFRDDNIDWAKQDWSNAVTNWWGVSLIKATDPNTSRVLLETHDLTNGGTKQHWVGAQTLAASLKATSAPTVNKVLELVKPGNKKLELADCKKVSVGAQEVLLHGKTEIPTEKLEEITSNYLLARDKVFGLLGDSAKIPHIDFVISTELGSHVSPKYARDTFIGVNYIDMHSEFVRQNMLIVIHPDYSSEEIIAHELGHIIDPCTLEQFLLSGDHLSEAFADVTSYLATDNPEVFPDYPTHPNRRLDVLRYNSFREFLYANSQMHGYAGIHEGGRFFAYVFFVLSLKIDKRSAWQLFYELRQNLGEIYGRIDWANIPVGLRVSETGRFETEMAARTLTAARLAVLQFFKDDYSEYYDDVYKLVFEY